jgi:hypothetical protein
MERVSPVQDHRESGSVTLGQASPPDATVNGIQGGINGLLICVERRIRQQMDRVSERIVPRGMVHVTDLNRNCSEAPGACWEAQ